MKHVLQSKYVQLNYHIYAKLINNVFKVLFNVNQQLLDVQHLKLNALIHLVLIAMIYVN